MTFAIVLVILLVGVIVGLLVRGFLLTREDRRRLDQMVARLTAEQRIDSLTRQTMAAMRDAVRRHS